MNTRGVVALAAVLGLVAGCTSRTGGESPDPPEQVEQTSSSAVELADMLTETETALETLTTFDAADVEGSLDEWESVVTGAMLTDFQTNRATYVESLTTAGASSESTVLATAATEFDSADGTAEVLVAVKVMVTQPGAGPTEKQQRMRIGMTMTDDGWKIESTEQVPYSG